MHQYVLTGLVTVLLVASVVTSASADPSIITESEVLAVLNEAHPAVAAAAEAVELAEAHALGATKLDNPAVGVVRETPGSSEQTEILVSWQLPELGRSAQRAAHERHVSTAKARLAQELLVHRLAMRQAYADWAIAEARERRLTKHATRVSALAHREMTRSANGEISGLEARRLGLAALALRSRLTLASVETTRARAEVMIWLPSLANEGHPMLPELVDAPLLTGATAQVRLAEAELAAAELTRRVADRFISSPEVTLGWQRQEAGREVIDGPIIGLAWSVPIFNRNQAARDAADASIEGAQARLELVERRAHASRTAAVESYEQLATALSQVQQELAQNKQMVEAIEAAFRHGEATVADLLETHQLVTEAELARLDLYAGALAAHRDLERLAAETKPITTSTQEDNP